MFKSFKQIASEMEKLSELNAHRTEPNRTTTTKSTNEIVDGTARLSC